MLKNILFPNLSCQLLLAIFERCSKMSYYSPKYITMELTIKILIGLIALLHCYILWFEMFAWETRGRKIFRKLSAEVFPQTKVLAANQGLYNGFLAAGLIWTFFISDTLWQTNVAFFFLSCVAVAGIYGAITADRKIFFVQALPALIAVLLLIIDKN